jgi:hypothetical protein
MENIDDEDEEEQQPIEVIESPDVESQPGSADVTAKVEQPQPTSLIQSLLFEPTEGKKKKKKVKTDRQKELVKIFIIRIIFYPIFSNIGTIDQSNKNYFDISRTIESCL